MQSTVPIFCTLEAFDDRGVFVEFLLLDSHIYSDNILPDNAASTDV